MDYVIAIPSYKRVDNQKTYHYLQDIGTPMENVYVFVQNKKDYEEYRESGIDNVVFHSKKHNNAGNRNNILEYFPQGQKIVMMDDDIPSMLIKDGATKSRKIETFDEFDLICKRGFILCHKHHAPVWGVNQSCNSLYFTNTVSTRCMISIVFGIINTDLRFNENLDLLVDTELCCQLIRKYGAIPRMNYVGCNNAREIPGGCKEFYEQDRRKDAIIHLLATYSDLLEYNPRNKNAMLNFKRKKAK